jgi:hypothetical protein
MASLVSCRSRRFALLGLALAVLLGSLPAIADARKPLSVRIKTPAPGTVTLTGVRVTIKARRGERVPKRITFTARTKRRGVRLKLRKKPSSVVVLARARRLKRSGRSATYMVHIAALGRSRAQAAADEHPDSADMILVVLLALGGEFYPPDILGYNLFSQKYVSSERCRRPPPAPPKDAPTIPLAGGGPKGKTAAKLFDSSFKAACPGLASGLGPTDIASLNAFLGLPAPSGGGTGSGQPGAGAGGGTNPGGGGNPPAPQCSDGVDNDTDGFIDLNDPVCDSPSDNSESGTSSKIGTAQVWGSDPIFFPACPAPSVLDEQRYLYVEIPVNAGPPPPTAFELLHGDDSPFASGEKICGGGSGVTETYVLSDPPTQAPLDPPAAGKKWIELKITTHNPLGSGNAGGQTPTVRLKLTWGH